MECRNCGHGNRPEAKFCDRCGSELASACPACGGENDSGARFCRDCGHKLEGTGEITRSLSGEMLASAMPASLASGRYVVRRPLGQGARKRVYLAHDSLLDRRVAVAQIKNEGMDEPGRTRIRRETQAMARLGDHPHIVTIHDVFEEAGSIYIVSQYMAGGSIEEVLAAAPDHRLEIERALKAAREIASALDHAHSRGVVHRDLKPANVWLTEDGTAKLGDFGLAVAVDQSRLTSEGMIVGTVSYIAPEQALGNAPDARSDLYGLGVMVYEMLAGRPPFLGDDAVSVISQHISNPPVGLSWHNKQITPSLEGLVMRLLAKEPDERPRSASEVVAALDSLTHRGTEGRAAPAVDDINPLDRLAAGVFVGREREMSELKRYVDDALSGHPRLVMLVGEPGIGKTRMTEEVSTYARMRGAQVLLGRCYETEGAPSYWPWIQLIRSYVHDRPQEALSSDMGTGAANIAQVVSELREKLPGLPQPPALDPEATRFRLFDSIASFLRNASQNKPLVLLLDDLHWADKPSLLLLQFLVRELQGSRLLAIATYRDVELGRHHPLSQTLAELAGEHALRRISLRGLERSDVARFIELTTGEAPDPALADGVYRETEGNPFFVSETVRLLTSEGKLTKVSGSWSVTIPQGVREVLGRRLDRLSPQANSVLSVASVIGRDFGLNVLQRVIEMEKDGLLDALEEAFEARIISEGDGVGRYRFSHALVRETLYEDLSTTRRLRLHAKVADALESLHPGHLDRYLPELAHHFFEASAAGEVDKAIMYSRLAAERAMSLTAYEEAVGLYDKALQVFELKQQPDDALLCDLSLGLGRAQTSAGETVKARESFSRAADLARQMNDHERMARAALEAGDVWVSAGWFEEDLISLLETALAMQPQGDSPLRALLTGRLGEAVRFTSESHREAVLSAEALEMARRLGDPQVLAQTLFWRFIALGRPEDVAERRKVTEDLVDVSRRTGDTRRQLLGLRNSVFVSMESGDSESPAASIEEYERLAAQTRLPLFNWFVPLMKSAISLLDGRLEEAESLLDEARRLGSEAQDPNVDVFTWTGILTLRRYQGRLDDVESFLPSKDSVREFLWMRTGLPLISLLRGDSELAGAELKRLANDGFAVVPPDWGRLWFLYDLAELAARLGDKPAAEVIHSMLAPYESHMVTVFPGIARGPVTHPLGLLEAALGRFDEAETHFVKALQSAREIRGRPMKAKIQADYSGMLITRDRPGDKQAALELSHAALSAAREIGMTALVKDLVERKLAMQGALHGSVGGSLHAVASAVDEEKPDLRGHASPDGTVTLLFSDIEDSTALNERLGDARWLEILRKHNSTIRREVASHRGYEVKNYGDGFMLAFSSARSAVLCAVAIQRAFDDYNRSGPDVPLKVRIGLHTGEAMREAGDFFGRHVNMAARVAGQAAGGQILVSEVTRTLVSGSADLRFGQMFEVPLKGLSQPQKLFELEWSIPAGSSG